jgi:hypothetical protein
MVRGAFVLMASWVVGWSVLDFAPAPQVATQPVLSTAAVAAAVQPL